VAALVTSEHRQAAIFLAWQCWQLGDHALAGDLLARALDNMPKGPERLRPALLAIEFLWQTGQLRQADKVMESLLDDKALARRSELWRLAAVLAKQRKQEGRSGQCLEKAVDIDFRHLPEAIDLAAVRHDLGLLLSHYQQTTEALATLNKSPPQELVVKVIRTAERWRALDPDNANICPVAAQILYKLGAKKPAWDYLNTPQAFLPPEAESWLTFAQALSGQEDFAMADLAYEQACQAEPDNARLLWDRAKNLERAGKKEAARKVYTLLAGGKWDDQFQWIQDEARGQLKGR
jgi:tetratricopeptide (TPR) repeat protein